MELIIERPLSGDFHFPVVNGISSEMPMDERERRMAAFRCVQPTDSGCARGSDGTGERSGSSRMRKIYAQRSPDFPGEQLQAAWRAATGASPNLRYSFISAIATLKPSITRCIENIGEWRATAGRVESIDLRFSREAVVNSETPLLAQQSPTPKIAQHIAQHTAPKQAATQHDSRKQAAKKSR